MKFLRAFFVAMAIALEIIGSQKSYADPAKNATMVLQNGFLESNKTIEAAANIGYQGFSQAIDLITTNPELAQEIAEAAVKNVTDGFYKAGVYAILAAGKASGYSNGRPREALAVISQELISIALNILQSIRTNTELVNEGLNAGGNVSIQIMEAILVDMPAKAERLYHQFPISLKQSIEAVQNSDDSATTNKQNQNSNADAAANDREATDSIVELNKTAEMSIKNGANASLVDSLKNKLISSIGDIAEISAFSRSNFKNYTKSAEDNTDPILARKLFLDNCVIIQKRIIEIFVNVCFDIGEVAANQNLSEQQLENAYLVLEHGLEYVTFAEMVAKDTTLDAYDLEPSVREMTFSAAMEIGKNGKIAYLQSVFEAGSDIFNLL